MAFVADLDTWIREHRPGWETAFSADGRTLRIQERTDPGQERAPGTPHAAIDVQENDGALLLDWAWKLPVTDGKPDELRNLVVDYLDEAFENHGWEVPVVLRGGPLNGKHLTKPREDLVGRLMFARKGSDPAEPHRAELYKWHLKRNRKGEYICVFERSLHGPEVDRFIARGVESTGPFVLIHDRDLS